MDKKKILNFISNFSDKAKEDRWISHYDADSDSLIIRTPNLSRDSKKEYVNDEFAFYLNRKSDVEGVFIEYFTSNFMAHHGDFKGLIKDLENSRENSAIVELNKKEVNKIIPELEAVIINS
ncbi:MAG: hypothetical protein KGL39_23395, partial [Patescibacteria group bacterium]|nr:hypothetical protein [Patescibacteria group bacterium]